MHCFVSVLFSGMKLMTLSWHDSVRP